MRAIRLPQARPLLSTKMKVGSDAEQETATPHTLLAPGGAHVGPWGVPEQLGDMGELVTVLGVTPSPPSTPFLHDRLQWVALWAQSTTPHIRLRVWTGCWG